MLPFLNRNALLGFFLKKKWTYLLTCHTWAGHLCEIKSAKLILNQNKALLHLPATTKPQQHSIKPSHRQMWKVPFCSYKYPRDICISWVFTDSGSMPTCLVWCVCVFMYFFYNHMACFCFPDLVRELLFEIKMFVSISSLIIVIQPAAAKWQNRCNDEN